MNDMPKLLDLAIQQVPSLVVLVTVVWMFLKHMNQQSKEFASLISTMHNDHLEARALSRAAITSQTESAKEMALALTVLSVALKK